MARGKKSTPGGYAGQPNRVGPSSSYGEGVKLAESQKVVPLPQTVSGPPGQGGPSMGPYPPPGQLPALNAPTERLDVPITDGASFGPGRNLGDIGLPTPPKPNTIDPKVYAVYLPRLEAVASMPNSSAALRSFVRRMRAQLPIDFDPTSEY